MLQSSKIPGPFPPDVRTYLTNARNMGMEYVCCVFKYEALSVSLVMLRRSMMLGLVS
jgi:hypothetical protein